MKKIKKAIIPAAGLGTRFLPATKAMSKEMLPIVDKPTIQYIIEEAIASGIEDIIIVTGKGKHSIEDHFDHATELEFNLKEKQKLDLLEKVTEASKVELHFIRQKEPKGLGHAIWTARKFIGNEPFAVLLGDDIVQHETPCLKQLMDQYYNTSASVVGVQEVKVEETDRYGIIDPCSSNDRLFEVKRFVEKPNTSEAPSNLAIMGRYILTPEIFTYLEKQEKGSGGEIQLTDAIESMNKLHNIYAYNFEGTRYDVGEVIGFVLTTLDFAMKREEFREELLNIMDKYVKSNSLIEA